MTTTLETIVSKYTEQITRYDANRKKLDVRMELLSSKLTALENKKRKLRYPYWVERLLRPVLAEIKKQLPEWVCDDKKFIPLGLGNRVSVFFCKRGLPQNADKWQEGNSIYITFLPGDLDKGELCYETGEKSNRFQSGTLGEVNGFNHITKVLESVEEAIAFLKQRSLTLQE